MKTKNLGITSLAIMAIFALFITTTSSAQVTRKGFTYEINLLGGSNIHDWTMKAAGNGGEANFVVSALSPLEGIQPLIFSLPVKALKSSEGLLNTRAYKALNSDKYPNIVFKLNSAKATSVQANKSQITITGSLTIAGVTRDVVMPAVAVRNADGTTTMSGTKKIKFTEFKLEPPSYMLGVMKVYDDLTVNYSVKF